ncbi:hypothetical protein N836_11185 [Leptolyngbya sp. Heron Island J]|nr:hypothetical protein N836_11185 [Leptolyngbya sp. Heron Island J]
MEANIGIWNLLHDGNIVAFSGVCPGDISVKVEIEYLCELLTPGSKFLLIHLRDCSDITYSPFKRSDTVIKLESLGECDLEILNAKNEYNYISVCCTEGIIRLSYMDAHYELDNGVPISFTTLSQACKKYWKDWEQHNRNDV